MWGRVWCFSCFWSFSSSSCSCACENGSLPLAWWNEHTMNEHLCFQQGHILNKFLIGSDWCGMCCFGTFFSSSSENGRTCKETKLSNKDFHHNKQLQAEKYSSAPSEDRKESIAQTAGENYRSTIIACLLSILNAWLVLCNFCNIAALAGGIYQPLYSTPKVSVAEPDQNLGSGSTPNDLDSQSMVRLSNDGRKDQKLSTGERPSSREERLAKLRKAAATSDILSSLVWILFLDAHFQMAPKSIIENKWNQWGQ